VFESSHVRQGAERCPEAPSPSTTITCCSCGCRCSGLEHLRRGIAARRFAILASASAPQQVSRSARTSTCCRSRTERVTVAPSINRREGRHRWKLRPVGQHQRHRLAAAAPRASPGRPPARRRARAGSPPRDSLNASALSCGSATPRPARCAAVIPKRPAPPSAPETAERFHARRTASALSQPLCIAALLPFRYAPPNCACKGAALRRDPLGRLRPAGVREAATRAFPAEKRRSPLRSGSGRFLEATCLAQVVSGPSQGGWNEVVGRIAGADPLPFTACERLLENARHRHDLR